MNAIRRLTAIAILAAATAAAAQQPAGPAAPASSPATYTKADITKNTACGAFGVGEVWSGPRKGTIEPREKPGYLVGPEGYWVSGCKMPEPPRDCPEKRVPSWTVGGYMCHPPEGKTVPARNAPFTYDVRAGQNYRHDGRIYYACRRKPDGTTDWVDVRMTCAPRPR